MNFKLISFFLIFLTVAGLYSVAQTKYSKLSVDTQMKDTFSFAEQWEYPPEVFQDDSTGELKRVDTLILTPADTAHLFYTARCTTDVQGGYDVMYCYANLKKDKVVLTFSDGLPAYASVFKVYIKGDGFYFQPKTIYPMYIQGQNISYQVTKQKLVLNKNHYKIGDTIIGYVDAEFIEVVSVPGKRTQKHKFYLRGYIRTTLKEEGL